MLEIYEIIWRNKDVTGYLEYDTAADKFRAYLKNGAVPNPRALFGILKTEPVADDRRVRAYIDDCVVPKTRENIDDILRNMKLPYYDQWEIYKYNHGENWSDYASIRPYKTIDTNGFVNPEKLC